MDYNYASNKSKQILPDTVLLPESYFLKLFKVNGHNREKLNNLLPSEIKSAFTNSYEPQLPLDASVLVKYFRRKNEFREKIKNKEDNIDTDKHFIPEETIISYFISKDIAPQHVIDKAQEIYDKALQNSCNIDKCEEGFIYGAFKRYVGKTLTNIIEDLNKNHILKAISFYTVSRELNEGLLNHVYENVIERFFRHIITYYDPACDFNWFRLHSLAHIIPETIDETLKTCKKHENPGKRLNKKTETNNITRFYLIPPTRYITLEECIKLFDLDEEDAFTRLTRFLEDNEENSVILNGGHILLPFIAGYLDMIFSYEDKRCKTKSLQDGEAINSEKIYKYFTANTFAPQQLVEEIENINHERKKRKRKVLTRSEEKFIFTAYRRYFDPRIAGVIVSANRGLVETVAGKYFNRGKNLKKGETFQDLTQEGEIAIFLKAARKFDPELNMKFSTYAYPWLKQTYERYFTTIDYYVRLPQHIVDDLKKIKRAEYILYLENEKKAEADDIAKLTGIPIEKIKQIQEIKKRKMLSLDAQLANNEDSTLADIIPSSINTDQELENRITATQIMGLMDDLIDRGIIKEREKIIIIKRFGLDGEEETLEQVGNRFGITRERVRQLEMRTISVLKRYVHKITPIVSVKSERRTITLENQRKKQKPSNKGNFTSKKNNHAQNYIGYSLNHMRRNELAALLANALNDGILNKNEIRILGLRKGLGDGKKRTQKEVAAMMGIKVNTLTSIECEIHEKLIQYKQTLINKKL